MRVFSAIIGMGVMLISFPIPGKVAHLVNNVQVERMKKTDARVQTVTECEFLSICPQVLSVYALLGGQR